MVAAGESWPRTCHTAVVALAQLGSVGEAMFGGAVHRVLGDAVAKKIDEEITRRFAEAAVEEGLVITGDRIITWRDQTLKVVEEQVDGFEMLQSRRFVDVKYRNKVVPKVMATCLANEIELRIRAIVLQRAVALELAPEMAAERMLGYSTGITDKNIKICSGCVSGHALKHK